jgi:hypothetical protein
MHYGWLKKDISMKPFFTFLFGVAFLASTAQKHPEYWQQEINYKMSVDVSVEDYTYTGTSKVVYTNNSPDTLGRVFFHLYFNAFQPGSDMDQRLQAIVDPDSRMVNENRFSRIAQLSEDEEGYLHVSNMTQNGGDKLEIEEEETVLVVNLNDPLKPGDQTVLEFDFQGQVPLQIRRSGRNSKEGVALSMSQWYPKMVEYDFEGWHAYPYIAREFHGVWGDFDVTLNIDKSYTVAASGYLQNPDEIGHGYSGVEPKIKRKQQKLSWHFVAPNVHDFMWAADPDYVHDQLITEDGITLHFFYKNKEELAENWKALQPKTADAMKYFNTHIGPYPYKQYSVIQGGDGGMEYAMATLITGERSFNSLVGVMVHELAHSWFQHVLATNEGKHAWMDEGFTSYISSWCMNEIMDRKNEQPYLSSYRGYYSLVKSGNEQPLTTHSDRYNFNYTYSIGAYSKGSVFLSQLGYIIGEEALAQTLKKYYSDFKFTHPTPTDIIRTAEKISSMHLGWYLQDWTQTTNTIDYAVEEVSNSGQATVVTLKRVGLMPMPIDVVVTLKGGDQLNYHIPLTEMRGEKKSDQVILLEDWSWAKPSYSFSLEGLEIDKIEIDPTGRMADIDKENNVYQAP